MRRSESSLARSSYRYKSYFSESIISTRLICSSSSTIVSSPLTLISVGSVLCVEHFLIHAFQLLALVGRILLQTLQLYLSLHARIFQPRESISLPSQVLFQTVASPLLISETRFQLPLPV